MDDKSGTPMLGNLHMIWTKKNVTKEMGESSQKSSDWTRNVAENMVFFMGQKRPLGVILPSGRWCCNSPFDASIPVSKIEQ